MSRTIQKFWFQTDFGRENSASFSRQGRQLAWLREVKRWSRSTLHFYLRLVKIWHVSLYGKFMQHLETCLLIAEADLYWIYKMKYNCYQDSSVIPVWFAYLRRADANFLAPRILIISLFFLPISSICQYFCFSCALKLCQKHVILRHPAAHQALTRIPRMNL